MDSADYNQALATVLRRKRMEAGLSQVEVGRRIGVAFQQLQKYEKGTNRVFFARFMQLAGVYGTTPEQLLAEVRLLLEAEAPEEPVSDRRQALELVRLANALPQATLESLLGLLRSVTETDARQSGTSRVPSP